MKKILLSLFVFASFLYSTNTFASIIVSPENQATSDGTIQLSCTTGSLVEFFTNTGVLYGGTPCQELSSFSIEDPRNYVFVECSNPISCGSNLENARNSEYFISELNYRIVAGENITAGIPSSIFYSRDPETGQSAANGLVAMVGNASSKTVETMGGIVGTIGGIILAFGFIMYIRSLVNEANLEKKRKEKGL